MKHPEWYKNMIKSYSKPAKSEKNSDLISEIDDLGKQIERNIRLKKQPLTGDLAKLEAYHKEAVKRGLL